MTLTAIFLGARPIRSKQSVTWGERPDQARPFEKERAHWRYQSQSAALHRNLILSMTHRQCGVSTGHILRRQCCLCGQCHERLYFCPSDRYRGVASRKRWMDMFESPRPRPVKVRCAKGAEPSRAEPRRQRRFGVGNGEGVSPSSTD